MTTAYATLADLAALGLPSAALASTTTVLGSVTHTGPGTGTATPSGTPAGSWSVVVQVVAPGAVGVATFRYSTDAGSTWSSTATTAASVVLGATGISVAFVGTFVAGDTYAFTATQAAQAALNAACDEADGYLRVRYTLPLLAWGGDLRAHVCALAAETILTARGFNPDAQGDPAVQARAGRARSWLRDVANGVTHPSFSESSPEVLAPVASSDTSRGW